MSEPVALEGAFLIERAVAAGLAIETLYCVPARESWARGLLGEILAPTVLSEAEISKVAGYGFHRGAFALAGRPRVPGISAALPLGSGRATILVMPEIGDPENLGSAFRNAAAFGCSALLLGPTGPDPLCRRVLRVSMGSSLRLPWARLRGPEEFHILASRGFSSAACVLDSDAWDIRSWTRPERLALVLGNEAFGLSRPWLDVCDARITLPMLGGTDSLNVATAAAVFLYIAMTSPSDPCREIAE
ncbi:MAG: RNA methyltransferase [Rectinemataceae bacterium]